MVYEIDGVTPVVRPTAFVHPNAVLIGDVIVGAHCYVGPAACLRGDFGRIQREEGANVQDACVMHSYAASDAVVERYGHIGHSAILHGCRIGENALVGMNAVVMDGAFIGADSLVAAMSFVRAGMQVPRCMVVGTPARVLRQLTDDEVAGKTRETEEYIALAAPEPGRRRVGAMPANPA